ncbi:phosphate ABC transporter substrate-binding protein, PhoT family (TC 3.A.1.7.1) [Acetomicrobium thermoterrenum DSM 13490]|jgi:phosphate transport system substrate-binding protein|uniref:Phosphate-binding protein n=1 Tax=Acetomicrobium thermoterrenum DSM 13490 TaxID=1120987 RepID=A0A1H3EZP5_9BACT|nr:phosphate ABC transporter substrate-binding protein [Acetomicrobium thermoterrenum]SDX84273.1 phosphate ABC transporter substrate-binding protein, PhoT family (TC 3.A.1.7.1) [Acetomicrobium thermoterrenum DSM 13490]
MKKLVSLLILVVLFGMGFGDAAWAAGLTMKGSTTLLPIAQAAIESYAQLYPNTEFSLTGEGSGNGIKALIDGTCDIANSSRFIKLEEAKLAFEKGAYPVPFGVAIDAIVPIIHPKNPVNNLTLQQLKDIYSGKITNWEDVGGPDKRIAVINRDTSSGTYEVWEEKVMNGERITPRAQVMASNGAIVQAVSTNELAIGYIGIGYLNSSVKAITVENIEAKPETARTGEFPISRYLFMFTRGWPTGETMRFINFMLSDEGQRIVSETGFVSIR